MTANANSLKIDRFDTGRAQNGKFIRLFGRTPDNKWIEKFFYASDDAKAYATKKGWTVTNTIK